MPAKQKPCTLPTAKNGKHTWQFLKNASKSTITHGPGGSHGRFRLVGVYSCACGASRVGQANHNAPGNDLRDHVGAAGIRVAGVEVTR